MPQATLLDIAKLNGSDAVIGLIEENLTYAPELSIVPARTIKGTSYKTVARDTYPGVGFRAANSGVPYTKSTFLNRLHEAYIFSGNIRVDVAVASAYEDGPGAFKAIESSGVMKQAMIDIGQQFFYGTAIDSKGFPGLEAFHNAFNTELTARSIETLVVDAGGTTAGTGSSVYGVKLGADGIQFIFGQNSTIELTDWFSQMVNDGTAGNDYLAEVASLNSWIGLQAGNPYCIGRLKDATAEVGKQVTDAKLAELLSKYPVGYAPDAWFMTRRSRFQLQMSRAATSNNSGKSDTPIAPTPTESNGIPIVITDSLTNIEVLS